MMATDKPKVRGKGASGKRTPTNESPKLAKTPRALLDGLDARLATLRVHRRTTRDPRLTDALEGRVAAALPERGMLRVGARVTPEMALDNLSLMVRHSATAASEDRSQRARNAACSPRKRTRTSPLFAAAFDFFDDVDNHDLLCADPYSFKDVLARFEADGGSTAGYSHDGVRKVFARARKEIVGQIAR